MSEESDLCALIDGYGIDKFFNSLDLHETLSVSGWYKDKQIIEYFIYDTTGNNETSSVGLICRDGLIYLPKNYCLTDIIKKFKAYIKWEIFK